MSNDVVSGGVESAKMSQAAIGTVTPIGAPHISCPYSSDSQIDEYGLSKVSSAAEVVNLKLQVMLVFTTDGNRGLVGLRINGPQSRNSARINLIKESKL